MVQLLKNISSHLLIFAALFRLQCNIPIAWAVFEDEDFEGIWNYQNFEKHRGFTFGRTNQETWVISGAKISELQLPTSKIEALQWVDQSQLRKIQQNSRDEYNPTDTVFYRFAALSWEVLSWYPMEVAVTVTTPWNQPHSERIQTHSVVRLHRFFVTAALAL